MKAVGFVLLLAIIFFIRLFYYLSFTYAPGEKISLIHTFIEESQRTGTSYTFIADSFFVRVYSSEELSYGTSIRIDGVVGEQIKDSRLFVLKKPQIKKVDRWFNPVLMGIGAVRKHIITTFISFLPPDEAGLLLGIVFGIKGGIYLMNITSSCKSQEYFIL